MGAIIKVHTDRVIEIEGVPRLDGYAHRPIPDRIEAASWGAAALATGGDVFVRGARQADMMTFLNVFRVHRRQARRSTDGPATAASGSGTRAAS